MKYIYHWTQYSPDGVAFTSSENGYDSIEECKAGAPKNNYVKFFREVAADRCEVDMTGSPIPEKTTKEKLVAELKNLYNGEDYDPEGAHGTVERLLLEYINDPEITALYNKFKFWYA